MTLELPWQKLKVMLMDEGVDISETVDFYERTFNEVV